MRALFAFISAFICYVLAVSDTFTLTLDASDKSLKKLLIYEVDGSVIIGDSSLGGSLINGTIQEDGTVKISSSSFLGISKNYLTVTEEYKEYASTFAINKDGYLTLYRSKDFKVLPSGSDGQYILGSNQATSSEDIYTVKIKCIKTNGKKANKFSVVSSGAGSGANTPLVFVLISVLSLNLIL